MPSSLRQNAPEHRDETEPSPLDCSADLEELVRQKRILLAAKGELAAKKKEIQTLKEKAGSDKTDKTDKTDKNDKNDKNNKTNKNTKTNRVAGVGPPAAAAPTEYRDEKASHRPRDVAEDSVVSVVSDISDDDHGVISEDNINGFRRLCFKLEDSDPKLNDLEIDCSKINAIMADRLSDLIPVCEKLKRLYLTAPDKEDINLLLIIMRGVGENSSITHIQINGIALSRESMQLIGSDIADCASLKKVYLTNCHFLDEGAFSVFLLGLQQSRSINELHFMNCDLSATYACDLVAASISFLDLKELSLVNTQLSCSGLEFLFKAIGKSRTLKHLDLSKNKNVGKLECVTGLARALRSSHVETLFLESCEISGKQTMKELCKRTIDSSLKRINLSNNPIGDKGAYYLNVLHTNNKSLKELNVDNCGLSSEQKKAINSGVMYNKSLLGTLGVDREFGLSIEQLGESFIKAAEGAYTSAPGKIEELGASLPFSISLAK